jgi:hypothetical protein
MMTAMQVKKADRYHNPIEVPASPATVQVNILNEMHQLETLANRSPAEQMAESV